MNSFGMVMLVDVALFIAISLVFNNHLYPASWGSLDSTFLLPLFVVNCTVWLSLLMVNLFATLIWFICWTIGKTWQLRTELDQRQERIFLVIGLLSAMIFTTFMLVSLYESLYLLFQVMST